MCEDIDSISAHHRNMTAAECAAAPAAWFNRYGNLYRPRTAERFTPGGTVNGKELREGRASRLVVRASIEGIIDVNDSDAWIRPAATGTDPEELRHRAIRR